MAGILDVWVIIEHCIQAEIIQIGERKTWTRVEKRIAGKVVKVDAALAVAGVEPILVAEVEVKNVARVGEITVIAEIISVGNDR